MGTVRPAQHLHQFVDRVRVEAADEPASRLPHGWFPTQFIQADQQGGAFVRRAQWRLLAIGVDKYQESGIRNRGSGIRGQESQITNQKSQIRITPVSSV